jgi:hypothetical protein
MIRFLRQIIAPPVLRVRDLRKDITVNPDRRGLKLVLGWLVHIAMDDGMIRLQLGLAESGGGSWMKFFGPFWYAEPVWWDMVPPEAYCYPTMLQVCFSLAQFEADLPLRGTIPASKGGERLKLEFMLHQMQSFEVSWDKRYASDRRAQFDGVEPPTVGTK